MVVACHCHGCFHNIRLLDSSRNERGLSVEHLGTVSVCADERFFIELLDTSPRVKLWRRAFLLAVLFLSMAGGHVFHYHAVGAMGYGL